MQFNLVDSGGTESVRLGMARSKIQSELGKSRAFRRTPQSALADQFIEAGVMATYDEEERVSFLEFAPPADPYLRGVRLIGVELAAVRQALHNLGLDPVDEDEGVEIREWKMALYAPAGIVEGVLLGE